MDNVVSIDAAPAKPTTVMGTRGAASLIKQYFGASNQEILALPGPDRVALGSAIARELKFTQADCNFELVAY